MPSGAAQGAAGHCDEGVPFTRFVRRDRIKLLVHFVSPPGPELPGSMQRLYDQDLTVFMERVNISLAMKEELYLNFH